MFPITTTSKILLNDGHNVCSSRKKLSSLQSHTFVGVCGMRLYVKRQSDAAPDVCLFSALLCPAHICIFLFFIIFKIKLILLIEATFAFNT